MRIAVAYGDRLLRELLCSALKGRKEFRLVEIEPKLQPSLVEVVVQREVDILVIGRTPPGVDLVETIRRLRERISASKVLLVGQDPDHDAVSEALKAGARGYISGDSGVSELLEAIQAVHDGEIWIERRLLTELFEDQLAAGMKASKPREHGPTEELTPRELEILAHLVTGRTNREIATSLFISEKTVKAHLNHIFKKIQVVGRTQAVVFALQKGLGKPIADHDGRRRSQLARIGSR